MLRFPFINSEEDVREHMQYRGMYYNMPELKRLSSREARRSVEDIINQANIYEEESRMMEQYEQSVGTIGNPTVNTGRYISVRESTEENEIISEEEIGE